MGNYIERIYTKGNVEVQNINIGDIHYEFEYGISIECRVLTLPQRDENGYWTWTSENVRSGEVITYGVSETHSHYAPNLYDYEPNKQLY